MLKIRESKALDEWFIFNGHREPQAYMVSGFISGLISLFGTLIMTAGPFWYNPFIFVPLGLLFFITFTLGVPNLGKAHVLYGVPENPRYGRGNGHRLKQEARFYIKLPSADKALYPANILEIIKNPHLTPKQRTDVSYQMEQVGDEIQRRNKTKDRLAAELAARHIDVDGVISSLQDSMSSVKAETSVWSDELNKIQELR